MAASDLDRWMLEMRLQDSEARSRWFRDELQPALLSFAAEEYLNATSGPSELVETTLEAFTYQFDILHERATIACGIVTPPPKHARDKSRMAGFPSSAGSEFDRGHLIPHSAGGGLDINLFLQLAKVNRGPFRGLERMVVQQPGSFYAVRLLYAPENDGQVPDEIEQAFFPLSPAEQGAWRRFDNRLTGTR